MPVTIYSYRNNRVEGPFDELIVREGLANGNISPEDLYCWEGTDDWKRAADLFDTDTRSTASADAPNVLSTKRFTRKRAILLSLTGGGGVFLLIAALIIGARMTGRGRLSSSRMKNDSVASTVSHNPMSLSGPTDQRSSDQKLKDGNDFDRRMAPRVGERESYLVGQAEAKQKKEDDYDEQILRVAASCNIIPHDYPSWSVSQRHAAVSQLDGIGFGAQMMFPGQDRFTAIQSVANLFETIGPPNLGKFEDTMAQATVTRSQLNMSSKEFVSLFNQFKDTFKNNGTYYSTGADGTLKLMLAYSATRN